MTSSRAPVSSRPTLDPHVFRAYDIRGVGDKNITEELCLLVGKAFGSELQELYSVKHPTVIVGRDARTHSPRLEKALIDGLVSSGCHVKTIGQTPSPVNYFSVCHFDAEGSVQVTASHNPKEDNGLKIQIRNAEVFAGENIQKLRRRVEEGDFTEGEGSVEEIDGISPYIEKATSIVPLQKPLKVVVDYGNGVAGPVYGEALRKAGLDLTELYAEPDGTFPNHPADPSDYASLKDLQEAVRKEDADCGIAFDGDGDRVGFVDENGKIVSADYLLLLLAEDYLSRHPGSPVIHTVLSSSILETEVKRMGGKPVMCEVGHSFVEHVMLKEGSLLGGEQSGHIFCGEGYHSFDDALVAALRILAIFAGDNQPLSQIIDNYPKVFQTLEWRPHCPDEKKTDVVRRITEHFEKDFPCITIDGVRVDFGDGAWAGIRQSNTSPKISVCIEARSQEKLDEIEGIVKDHLAQYPEIGA